VNRIELCDEQRGVYGVIDVSPVSGQPHLSLWDKNGIHGVSIGIGGNGHAQIGIAGKNSLVVGLSAHDRGHRCVFVMDDEGREVFEAGIDRNGIRYIKLLAADGSVVWEATDEKLRSKG
jgi:hypothetical protein